MRLLNQACYLSAVVLWATVTRLPHAGCQGQGVLLWRDCGGGGSLISCDPSQAFSPQLHCFIMTWTPPGSLQTTLAPSKYHICHLCLNPQSWIMFECEMESERGWRERKEGVIYPEYAPYFSIFNCSRCWKNAFFWQCSLFNWSYLAWHFHDAWRQKQILRMAIIESTIFWFLVSNMDQAQIILEYAFPIMQTEGVFY